MPTYCKINTTAYNPKKKIWNGGSWPFHSQDLGTPEKYKKMIETLFEIERDTDPGVDMDSYMVVHPDKDGVHQEWQKYDRQPIKRGTFYVIYEPRDGGNYQMFNTCWQRVKDSYDWFIFTCDDIMVFGDQYYAKILERWGNGVGFVALQGGGDPATPDEPQHHVQGSIGLTSGEILKQVADGNNGELPHSKAEKWVQENNIREGEIPFTQRILYLGYHFVNYNDSKEWKKENLCYPYYDYIEGR